jgi:hypothetical protein
MRRNAAGERQIEFRVNFGLVAAGHMGKTTFFGGNRSVVLAALHLPAPVSRSIQHFLQVSGIDTDLTVRRF